MDFSGSSLLLRIGFAMCGAGVFLVIGQFVLLLLDGYWLAVVPSIVVGEAPFTGWNDIDGLIYWLWAQPVWAIVAPTGLALTALGLAAQRP